MNFILIYGVSLLRAIGFRLTPKPAALQCGWGFWCCNGGSLCSHHAYAAHGALSVFYSDSHTSLAIWDPLSLYSIYGMKRQLGFIGHDAHIGGAVGGYTIMLLLRPELLATDLWLVLLMALPIGLLYTLEQKGII